MPAARGVKRAASKSSTASASMAPKNKKKRGPIQLEAPTAPKRRGHVLACGQGDVGQLGLGDSVMETTKFKYVTALGDKIVDVYAGGMHTIALDSSGKVWTFGCNDEGALGRDTSGDDEGTPKRVALPARALAISAGDSHTAALLDNGDVYAWGAFRDSHGSMGLVVQGREVKSCREPVKVDIGETAVAIASGSDHLVILSASGGVYSMGCGEQGQLGRLSQRSATREARQGFSALLSPAKVTLKAGASRIWAGYHATFALDANNDKVFAWGLNNYGQLGITGENRKTALFAPTQCDAFNSLNTSWQAVACGQHHSLALDTDGHVYAVGRCDYGRLGLGDRPGDAEALEPIPKLQNKKVVSIAAGTSNSFAVTDTGEIFSWGMGSEGQLGTGGSADAAEPTPGVTPPLSERTPRLVSAGGQHTVLLVEDPSSGKEASPSPESETSDQKTEDSQEEEEKEEVVPAKRQKKEQEGEISSTSAQSSEVVEETKPEKVNGDEKKETPMDVDQTDNTTQEQKEETKPEEQSTEQAEPTPTVEQPADSKPETTNTSSQETTDNDSKSQENSPDKTDNIDNNDVEMSDKAEVNGTPDAPVETKSVESIQTANPITTTA